MTNYYLYEFEGKVPFQTFNDVSAHKHEESGGSTIQGSKRVGKLEQSVRRVFA